MYDTYVSEISTEPAIYPTPTQPVTYPTPTTVKLYPTFTQPVTYPTPTTEKTYPTPTQPVTYPTPTTEKFYPTPTTEKTYPTPTQPVTYATSPTPLKCSSSEQSVKLNYAETLRGTSELMLLVILPDGRTLQSDVSKAIAGSGTWLSLPPIGDDYKPVRLLIRYLLRFSLIAVSLSGF